MLRYHAAYYLPKGEDKMVVAEVLDFPGACSQGFDLADARVMIASALEDAWTVYREPLRIDWQPGTIYPLPEAVAKSGPKSRVALKELPSHEELLAGWNKN